MEIDNTQIKLAAKLTYDCVKPAEILARLEVSPLELAKIRIMPQYLEAMDRYVNNEPDIPEDTSPEALKQMVLEAAPAAFKTLLSIMGNSHAHPSTQLKAAEWVLARLPEIAAMEMKKDEGSIIQQIYVDKRASEALARIVGETTGENDFLAMLDEVAKEMPPSTA